jgi:prolipoprotein diacylglyceryltransferase
LLWDTLDALTPLFAVTMIGISISHLASGNAYGSITTLPWGIELWGAQRHPSQIYEIIASSFALFLIWRDTAHNSIRGALFLKFMIVTSTWLILVEGFKGDSLVIANGFRGYQIGYFIILVVAIFLYNKRVTNGNAPITG